MAERAIRRDGRAALLQRAEAEILKRRHRLGEDQWLRAVDLDAQRARVVALGAIEADAALAGAAEAMQFHDVLGGFRGAGALAVGNRQAGGITLGKHGRAIAFAQIGEALLHGMDPAAQHLLDLLVERLRVGHVAPIAQIESEADERETAILQRDRPAEQGRAGGVDQHLADCLAPVGREIVAHHPDEGEEMAAERIGDQFELGPWTVRQGHGGEGDALAVRDREGDHEIVRQRGQRMDHGLGGMTRRIIAEAGHQREQCVAQDGDLLGPGRERGARPQARMNGKGGDGAPLAHGHDEQVNEHIAVHARDAAGLEDERPGIAGLEPGDGLGDAGLGQQRLVGEGADALGAARLAIAVPPLMAEQRHVPSLQPAQQIAALARPQPVGVGVHRVRHRAPGADRSAHMGERQVQRLGEGLPRLGVDTVRLDVDERFAHRPLGIANAEQLAVLVPADRQDRVGEEVDDEPGLAQAMADAVDEEGLVGIDDGEALAAPTPIATQLIAARIDEDRRFALPAHGRRLADESGGGIQRGAAQRIALAAVQPLDQRIGEDGQGGILDLKRSAHAILSRWSRRGRARFSRPSL